ncbi:MAG TPA: FG-GAP-like repeat-containing protein, partial [Thermoanaerobaculia bacterium]|nr:FG-GAP-like repeat-containing protein [Thermoanaerobaculia bacterium]
MRLTTLFATTLLAFSLPVACARAAAVRTDFNRDGKSDIVLQNTKSGDVAVWLMNGGTALDRKVVATPGADWHVVATGDLDHDGTSEIIVQNSATRAIAAWKMNGTTRVSETTIATPAMAGWRVVGTRDVTGDGNDDILLQNTSGALAVWEMNGVKLTAGRPLGNSAACGLATGNFGGNAFLVYDSAQKSLGRRGLSETAATALDRGDIEQIAVGDFDGDGDDDVVEQLAGGSAKVLLFAAGGAKIENTVTLKLPGSATSVIGTGDYDGNGRTEILTYSPNDGVTAWQLDGSTIGKRWNLATEANWKPFATTAACMTSDPHAGHAAAAAVAVAAPYAAKGTNVTFASPAMGYLSLPAGTGKKPAIIVIQEWWGVNDWIRQQADRFASQGYVALAVDLYRGRSASTQDEAHELSRALPHDRAVGDLKAAFDY